MKKFAFIGGGSFGFTRKLVKDILTFPAFQDAEIVMLARPRKIFLAMGDRDTLFSADGSRREFERIKEVFADYKEWTDLTIFSGGHELFKENDLFDRLLEELRK